MGRVANFARQFLQASRPLSERFREVLNKLGILNVENERIDQDLRIYRMNTSYIGGFK